MLSGKSLVIMCSETRMNEGDADATPSEAEGPERDAQDDAHPEGEADAGPSPTEDGATRQSRLEIVPDSAAIKLSSIFAAMQPADAAAVLQEMTDEEVESIIQHMQARLAGQILGQFEPERAALLSRVVLNRDGGR